jgi:hypothetical protein
MESEDVERIARSALRELGAGDPPVTITAEGQPDRWRLNVGGSDPISLTIRAGAGTTPGHIREQIFNQFSGR